MALSLSQAARDAEDVASGLQHFEDNVPEEPELHLSVRDLVRLAKCLKTLDSLYSPRLNSQLNEDVGLLLFSLQYTLGRVHKMFGETRYVRNGQRPYRVAWEDMCYELREIEGSEGLRERLSLYEVFANDMIDSLEWRHVPPDEMNRHRGWINLLLNKQELASEEGLSDAPSDESPYSPLRVDPRFRPNPPEPPWEYDSLPYDADTDSPPLSTATYSSTQTVITNSSETVASGHWANAIFDTRPPKTAFDNVRGLTRCYGIPERGLVERLNQHTFFEVARFHFRADNVKAQFYWRPTDHRTRLLISEMDQRGAQLRFCAHLTDLKAVREENVLKLCRRSYREDPDFSSLSVWAEFSFDIYEKLVLFYCIFAGMKNQDWRLYPPTLRDWYYKPQHQQPQGEAQMFSALIEDGGYIHVLRLYYDYDSSGSRLEARANGGPMKLAPIWTAFITEQLQDAGWATRIRSKSVQLYGLHQYVFCDGYAAPRSHDEEAVFTFMDSRDADNFMDAITTLHVHQSRTRING